MTLSATGMRICRPFTFLLFSLLAACAAPGPDENIAFDQGGCNACQTVFPWGGWQFVHEIVFHFPAGEGRFLGVVVLDKDELRCALTTLEGLTVFSAKASKRADGPIEVQRALPPLDKPGFAAGLLADLRLLFIAPAALPRCGWRHGERLCRWGDGGTVEDISLRRDNCWTIQAFRDGRLVRTARAETCVDRDGYSLPGSISLHASGDANYQLEMRLISAEKTGQ
jgi:hypothetical protein